MRSGLGPGAARGAGGQARAANGDRERARHVVGVLAYDGMAPFELSIVVEVFGLPRPELGSPRYQVLVCSEGAGPVRAVGGFWLGAEHDLDALAAADTVVVPGTADVRGDPSPAAATALRSAHRRGARIVSICSGAFSLAGAGLLDGLEAATHWRYAPLLAKRYPRVRVNPDVLYVDTGQVLTSAGSAAGIDLCLHLVRRDHGARVANQIARRLVMPPHRPGGQAQFIEAAVSRDRTDDALHHLLEWIRANLREPMDLSALAARAHMSRRTLTRRFRQVTGVSPHQWIARQRLTESLRLLESTGHPIDRVASLVGYRSAETFRQHFSRLMRTSPSAYRRAFNPTGQLYGPPLGAGFAANASSAEASRRSLVNATEPMPIAMPSADTASATRSPSHSASAPPASEPSGMAPKTIIR